MNTKPIPGTPSRHLPLAATSASNVTTRASIGKAANELIASPIRPLPWRLHTSLTACSGFSTPVPVSQWMKPTWVMLRSARNFASSASAETASSSACDMIEVRRPIKVATLPSRLQ